MARITIKVQDGVSVLLTRLNAAFIRVMFLTMCLISNCVDAVLIQYIREVFAASHLRIFILDVIWCTVLARVYLHLL